MAKKVSHSSPFNIILGQVRVNGCNVNAIVQLGFLCNLINNRLGLRHVAWSTNLEKQVKFGTDINHCNSTYRKVKTALKYKRKRDIMH